MFVDRYGLCFIHIPKTGGNALTNVLIDHSSWTKLKRYKHQDLENTFGLSDPARPQFVKHSPLSAYKQVGQSKTVFCVLREPRDRFVSYLAWKNRLEQKRITREFILAAAIEYQPLQKFLDVECRLVTMDKFCAPKMPDMLTVIALDFGALQTEWASFVQRFNLASVPITLPKVNQSLGSVVQGVYDEHGDFISELINERFFEEVRVYQGFKRGGQQVLQ